MNQVGERQTNTVIPNFNRSIRIDFRGAKISSDTGVLMLREIDERFNITAPLVDRMEDPRRASHLRHTYVDLIRQRVYQMAAGYEDCNDANHFRIDPALRLALGKDDEYAASQSMLSRLENEILGNEQGMAALDETMQRSIAALLRKKSKGRLILDMDSTEDPAHGRQDGVAYNGHFGKSCYHPLFCFTSEGDCLGVKLRNGNVHSAEGGRAEIENRIKEGKNALRWDKTSCSRFEANEARLKMGVLAYNLLHMLRKFYIRGEGVRRSIEWLILRLIKVGARVSYHAKKWHVHVATAFPLAHHYQEVFDSG